MKKLADGLHVWYNGTEGEFHTGKAMALTVADNADLGRSDRYLKRQA